MLFILYMENNRKVIIRKIIEITFIMYQQKLVFHNVNIYWYLIFKLYILNINVEFSNPNYLKIIKLIEI